MADRTYATTAALGWQPPVRKINSPATTRVTPLRYYCDRDDQIHKGLLIRFAERDSLDSSYLLLEFNDATQTTVALMMASIFESIPVAKNFTLVDQAMEQVLSAASGTIAFPGFPGGSGQTTSQTDLHFIRGAVDHYLEAGFVITNHLVNADQIHEARGNGKLNIRLFPESPSLFRSLSLADRAYTTGRSEFLELLHTRYGWVFQYSYLDNRGESRTGNASVFDVAFAFFTLLGRKGGVPLNAAGGLHENLEPDQFYDSSITTHVDSNYKDRLVYSYDSSSWDSSPKVSASEYVQYENEHISGLRRLTFHKDGQSDFHIYFDTSKVEGIHNVLTGGTDIDFLRVSGAETAPLGCLYPALPTSIAPGQIIDQPTGSMITGRLHSDADVVLTDTLANLVVALTSHLAERYFSGFSTVSSALPAMGGIPASSAESLQPIIDALATLTELARQSEGRFDQLDDGQRANLIATAETLLPPDSWGSHTDRVIALENIIKATFPQTLGDISLFGDEVNGGQDD